MRVETLLVAAVAGAWMPAAAEAQHSHGARDAMNQSPGSVREKESPPKLPAGLLPLGSPRPIEVLVLEYGFSPSEIRADVGETVTLMVRRADPVCADGLSIPKRQLNLELPLGVTIPVTLEPSRPERIELRCPNEGATAVIVVGSP